MRVAHLLRKYNPAEWGGTETALQRLFTGLAPQGVNPVIFCPRDRESGALDPFKAAGYSIKRFRACIPIWGLPDDVRRQYVSVGGNLMSFDLIPSLWREPEVDIVHSHALGRIGGIGLTVARRRHIPFVVSIHGGALDLPPKLKEEFACRDTPGWEWGKIFGWLLKARYVLDHADAILTCNPREAELLGQKYPGKRIQVQPHAVPMELFQPDHRTQVQRAFPQVKGKQILLCVGRIDPVKNQSWLIEQLPAVLQKHPQTILVLAGACTDQAYGVEILQQIRRLGLESSVLLTGGLPPGDPRLIGLFQEAAMVLLPSISETFGLVILEAWAAGVVPVSSRTSGAKSLIVQGENGFLFDLENAQTYQDAVDSLLRKRDLRAQFAAAGQEVVKTQFGTEVLAGKVKHLYADLIEQERLRRN